MAISDKLEQLAREMADSLCDWMGEGEQLAQVEQDEEAYWQHLRGKLGEYLDKAYVIGLKEGDTRLCARCRGTGQVYRSWNYDYIDCEACDGKGF